MLTVPAPRAASVVAATKLGHTLAVPGFDPTRLDRSAVSIGDVRDQSAEYRAAVLAMTPAERLLAIEVLRQVYYGPAKDLADLEALGG